VSGGSGNDWSEADYVLISTNNVTEGAHDPTDATYTSPKDGKVVNVGANVLHAGQKCSINGRGSCTVLGFSNVRVGVELGKQYAIALRLYSQCDDDTTLAWGSASVKQANN
jgi:hypothetical protein